MNMKECEGCIYNLKWNFYNINNDVKSDIDKFTIVLENCCVCKRAILSDELKNKFKDMYRSE